MFLCSELSNIVVKLNCCERDLWPTMICGFSPQTSSPTRVPLFQMLITSQIVPYASDQLAINQRFPGPPPWLSCESGAQNSENWLIYWFITKGIKWSWINNWMKRDIGPGAETRSFWSVEFGAGKWVSSGSPACKFRTPSFLVFMEASSHRCGWLNHWSLVIDSTSSLSLLFRGHEVGLLIH